MKTFKRALYLAIVASLAVSVPMLSAQPDDTESGDTGGETGAESVELSAEVSANLTPGQMQAQTEAHIKTMQDMLRRVVELQQVARKQKDVIKLNCVNDKLLQVKQLLNIADAAKTDMVEAIAQSDMPSSNHQFSQVTIAQEKVSGLRDEAEGCIGEELVFLGPTEVTVDGEVTDDVTGDDEYVGTRADILDPPAYASPFS